MKLRDEVIEDQKNILQNNKIKSQISYQILKNLDEIADEARINFPIIKKSIDQLGMVQHAKRLGGVKKPFLKEIVDLDTMSAPKLPKIETAKNSKKYKYENGRLVNGQNLEEDLELEAKK